MTADEKERIKELRLKGMGYKGIANLLGLTRDSVRGFCKRNGLDGDSCVVAFNVEEKVKRNLLCACCEKLLSKRNKVELGDFAPRSVDVNGGMKIKGKETKVMMHLPIYMPTLW